VPRRTAEVVRNILIGVQPLGCDSDIHDLRDLRATGDPLRVLFVVVSVGSLLFGDRLAPGDDGGMLPDGGLHADGGDPIHAVELRGTFTLCSIFLGVFVAVYVLNWYLLTQLWAIGA